MELLSVLVALVLTVSVGVEGGVGPSTNSSFCTESKECLEYELVCKTEEYEVRHYSPTRWVSTDAEAYFMGVGAAMAFRRLFQYITGANNQGVQMEMTAPVLVRIPEDTRVWEPAIYTLSFLLPAAYQALPPTPTNDKLYFTEMPSMDVYVRSYGGWMLSVTSRVHAHLLTQELARVQGSYNHSYHYGVGYDSPLKLINRHNEVWYIAKGDVICSEPREPTPPHTTTTTHTPNAHTPSFSPSPTAPNTTSDSRTDSPANRPPTPSQATGVTPSTHSEAGQNPSANSTHYSMAPQADRPWNNTVEALLEDSPTDHAAAGNTNPHLA